MALTVTGSARAARVFCFIAAAALFGGLVAWQVIDQRALWATARQYIPLIVLCVAPFLFAALASAAMLVTALVLAVRIHAGGYWFYIILATFMRPFAVVWPVIITLDASRSIG